MISCWNLKNKQTTNNKNGSKGMDGMDGGQGLMTSQRPSAKPIRDWESRRRACNE